MAKEVCLTEEEVLKNPNDSSLGELVRKKFWEKKKTEKKPLSKWKKILKNFY